MESHPVPQNISSFEFHLIGDMTLKQFLYLASGLGIAYLLFVFLAAPFPIIVWPLIVFFSILGIAFAFIPIQDRPLDRWLATFLKAIYHPTIRTYYSKTIKQENPNFEKRLQIYLSNISPLPNNPPPPPPTPIQSGLKPTHPTINQPVSQPLADQPEDNKNILINLPSNEELKKTVELAKQAHSIQTEILKTESEINKIRVEVAQPDADPQKFTGEFQKALTDLQQLNQKASGISKQIAVLSKEPDQKQQTPAVKAKVIPTLSLTAIPNIINGVVTDAMGNYVEGAILVTHDKQGLPVRALKTNKLGQFIAATPLSNGTYIISVEKDNLLFDNIEVELREKVIEPILISAKKAERIV